MFILKDRKIILIIFVFSVALNPLFFTKAHPQDTSKNNLGCNCVVFRIDDIQDDFLAGPQVAVMNLFLEKNQKLSLALILNFFGNDTSLVNKVSKGYHTEKFELASHGWNHENFSSLSEQAQVELFRKSNDKMHELFGQRSKIFVPPFYEFNNSTLNAMHEVGIKIISSWDKFYAGKNESNLIAGLSNSKVRDGGILHFPGTVLYSYEDNEKWHTYSNEQIIRNIEKSILNYGYAVVTLHPQSYSVVRGGNMTELTNATAINNLEKVVDMMRTKNIEIVSYTDLARFLMMNKK